MYEIPIYLGFVAGLFAYRTILSGRKNGCFYHKNDNPLPPMLEREIKNIHFIETPAWYVQELLAFFFAFSIQRSLNYSTEIVPIIIQIAISLLFVLGTIQLPSYHFQRGITAGLKDDDHLDAISQTEIAITIFGYKIQFWRGRLFSNRGRILAQWLGVIEILFSIFLIILYNTGWIPKIIL